MANEEGMIRGNCLRAGTPDGRSRMLRMMSTRLRRSVVRLWWLRDVGEADSPFSPLLETLARVLTSWSWA